MTPFLVIAGVLLLAVVWWVVNYNRFVTLGQQVKESWSNIDVELKRRYELIPNLVATVKGYAAHERDVLDRVIALRNTAAANHGPAESQARDENALLAGLKQVFVLAEGYPQLKADKNFLALQEELAITEDRIAAARRFFNGNVRELQNLRQSFPTSLIAGMAKVEAPTFFELDDAHERIVPRVDVGR